MASIKVEDYFGAEGGAADDSTDCTAAFQAALDALYTQGRNGELILPEGVCRIAGSGSVTKDFSEEGSPQGQIVVRGQGSAAVRFMAGTQATRFEITGSQTLICREVAWLGDMTDLGDETNPTEAGQAHVHLEGQLVIYENNQHYGLGMFDNALNRGLVWIQSGYQAVVRGCQWRGCWGNHRPNLFIYGSDSVRIEDTLFIDYGVYQSTSYSKGGAGCTHWIDIDNDGGSNETYGKVVLKNLYMDEGSQTSQVRVQNLEWLSMEDCYTNVAGAGIGMILNNVHTAEIARSNFGYAAVPDKIGVRATNVDLLRMKDVRFIDGGDNAGVDTVELLGTTRKLILDNCKRGAPTNRLPFKIVNTANAKIVQDGVTTDKNGITDYL